MSGPQRGSLDQRTGLPPALKVLLDQYPRPLWEGHGNFDGLTRFWLDRHLAFRDLLAALRAETQGFLDNLSDPRVHARRIMQMGNALIEGLHGHHGIEDAHYFPLLARAEPRLESGFALLDADHQALDGKLQALAQGANAHLAALQPGQGAGRAGALAGHKTAGGLLAGLSAFEGFLDRHLTDEEDLVVPVILHHAPRL